MKATKQDLIEFIHANITFDKKKSKNDLRKLPKEMLIDIVEKANCVQKFEMFQRAGHHSCKYCGGLALGTNTNELCDDCKMMFGHYYYYEL